MAYRLTKKELYKEIITCGKNPTYFINNYAQLSHPIEGPIPFNTYDYQDDLLNTYNDHRFVAILKARQLGISAITAAYICWLMLFHRDKNILVMATKLSTAANLVRKVKYMMKYIPDWLKIADIIIDNRNSFELSNGSMVKATTTSADAGRSEALSLLVVDEAAHVEGLEDLWAGVYSTLATGGRCVILSTPNGVDNYFCKVYQAAESGLNDFHPVKLLWDVHPDRDQEWFRKETKNMSKRQVAQELLCDFLMSGGTVFEPEDIQRIEKENILDPTERIGFDRNLWIWKRFDPKRIYLATADVARGDGEDYSACDVYDIENMEQVAEYQGKISTDIYAKILNDIGGMYGNCLVVVEMNTVGLAVTNHLREIGYPNLYWEKKGSHEYVESYIAETMSNTIPGFTTSWKSRPLIIAKMEELLRNKDLIIRSSRKLNDLKSFIWHNAKPQAMRGRNDDLVMSTAVACWVRDTALMAGAKNQEFTKALLNVGIMTSKSELDTKIPGMRGFDPTTNSVGKEYSQYGNGDWGWLIKG